MCLDAMTPSQAAYKASVDHITTDATGKTTRKLAAKFLTTAANKRVEGDFFWANTASPLDVERDGKLKVSFPAPSKMALESVEGDFFWAATASQIDMGSEEEEDVKVNLPVHLQHDDGDQGNNIVVGRRNDSGFFGKLRAEAAEFTPSPPALSPEAAEFHPASPGPAALPSPPLTEVGSPREDAGQLHFTGFIDDESPIPRKYHSALWVEHVFPPSPPLGEENGDLGNEEQTMPTGTAAGAGMVERAMYPIAEVEEEE